MKETVKFCRGDGPCKGCPDRYPACSDHCRKPEYLAFKAELQTIRENRRHYCPPIWKQGEVDSRKR